MATYNIVAVQRTPAQLTVPNLEELGPLAAVFNYTDILNEAPEANITVDTDSVEDDIKDSLRNLLAQPLEVIIYRDGVGVFQGPVISGEVSNTQLILYCRGLEFYTAYMSIPSDESWSAVDEFTIFTDVIDNWQSLDYGNYGIDTSGVGLSGTTRDFAIPGSTETRNVYDTLMELSEQWGLDWYADPDTRELVLGPRGSDKSDTVFLERGVQSANVQFGIPPGTIVSELFALGTSSTESALTDHTTVDTAVRMSFGRVGLAVTFDGADNATLLGDAAQAYIDDRGSAYFAPGPSIIPVTGADVDDFGVGDIVTYTFDPGLGQITGAWRIRKRNVIVSDTGQEIMEVEFI